MKQVLSIVVVLVVTASGVRAQPADSTTAPKVTLARRLYDKGVEAVGKGQWSLAHDQFKASYELAPRVLTLFNLAGAQGQTGRLVEAIENYRKFLRDTDDGRYPGYRTDATNQLELLGKQIAQLTLELTNLEPSDVIAIDEIEFPQVAVHEAIPMNPGTHVARIQRGTAMLASRTIALTAGAADTVHIDLPVRSPDLMIHNTPDLPIATSPAPPRPADHGSSHSWLRSRWLWSGVAVVVAGTATGAYLFTRPGGVIVK
jgi:hypothetical protein